MESRDRVGLTSTVLQTVLLPEQRDTVRARRIELRRPGWKPGMLPKHLTRVGGLGGNRIRVQKNYLVASTCVSESWALNGVPELPQLSPRALVSQSLHHLVFLLPTDTNKKTCSDTRSNHALEARPASPRTVSGSDLIADFDDAVVVGTCVQSA